jgi:hypothetical protein
VIAFGLSTNSNDIGDHMATDTNVNVNTQNVSTWQAMGRNLAAKAKSTTLLAGIGYLGGRLMNVDPLLGAACPNVFLISNRCMKEVTEGFNEVALRIQNRCGIENPVVLGDKGKFLISLGTSIWLTQQVANSYLSYAYSHDASIDLVSVINYTMLPLAVGSLALGVGVATNLIEVKPSAKPDQEKKASEGTQPNQEQKASKGIQHSQELKAESAQA